MDVSSLTYENLSDALVREFPRLKAERDAMVRNWNEEGVPGPHVIFGDLLSPLILELAQDSSDASQVELARIFDFLEALLQHPDSNIGDVVGATVCESICDDEITLQRTSRFMGPLVKSTCKRIVGNQP